MSHSQSFAKSSRDSFLFAFIRVIRGLNFGCAEAALRARKSRTLECADTSALSKRRHVAALQSSRASRSRSSAGRSARAFACWRLRAAIADFFPENDLGRFPATARQLASEVGCGPRSNTTKVRLGEDAETSTRGACAPRITLSRGVETPRDFRRRRQRLIPERRDSAAEKRMIFHQSLGSICRNQS